MTGFETRTGWTVGGGVEHMFGPRWTAKAEVLYVDFGTRSVTDGQGIGYTGRFRNSALVGRVGVNLKW
jgi:outer membrane immunogenic protein